MDPILPHLSTKAFRACAHKILTLKFTFVPTLKPNFPPPNF